MISVYMTVKNGYPCIKDAVDSIRCQSYSDWELVVVDDGSEDETCNYLRSIEQEDARFNFIYTEGVGRAMALNLAVNHTKGELIANLDADDLSHPDRLKRQLEVFYKNPSMNFLCAEPIVFNEDRFPGWNHDQVCGEIHDITSSLFRGNPVDHSSVMMRRSVFFDVGCYNEELKKIIDFDLWCRFILSGHKLTKIDDRLTAKRIHKNQSYENKARFNYLLTCFRIRKRLIKGTDSSIYHYILNLAIFSYGLLPQRVRVLVRKFL